ncbi:S8 family serine peptidase [Glaesserella parasuis]|uniref:S8 family serine peptidase n=1 Tax=Glaesserella parasuis TaxID=738 RepID=UPI002747EF13|nr:S8 family serine peptidase [Glaesserella parasuis]
MKKVRRYSEAAFVSLLVTACGGGDNSSNMTPINSGSGKIDETAVSSPILEESENQKSDSIISKTEETATLDAPKLDKTVPETSILPSDENVEGTVNPSSEPTAPEVPKPDETVSETPVTPSNENVEGTVEPSSEPTLPEVPKPDETVSETPVTPSDENVDVTVNPSSEPTVPEVPKPDETVSETPVTSSNENVEGTVEPSSEPTLPEVPKPDETVSETPVIPNDENIDVTVNPSPEPTTPEAPKSDEAVSEVPVTPSDEKVEETVTPSTETTTPDVSEDETVSETPVPPSDENVDVAVTPSPEPTTPEESKSDEAVSEVPVTPNDEKVEETVNPSTEPTLPEAPKQDETVSEVPVTPSDEKVEETVTPSTETTTPDVPKDETVSETPVPQNDETTEETKTEENTNSDTTIPETKKESITVHIEPTGEYTPKDKTRIFDEADRFSAQNGMIEKRSPQTHHLVDDEHRVHKIAVIDTDFSYNGTGDTFGNRLFINQGMWTVGKGNKYSHGSQVAAVVAAHNKTSLIYGYSTESYGMISPNTQHFDTAHSQGVRIFNNSYGNTPREESVKEKGWEGLTKNPLYEMLAKMAAEDSIFVWSAGNEGKLTQYGQHKHATIESHIPVLNDDARRGWITVAAITGKWKSDYSNNIGSRAQNWGIATYGDWKVFGDIGVQGTSFATPVVSAVVAKVWEHFPWMTNHLVTQTILSTASQLGTDNVTTGPNEQIGWGVLNESRALKGPARFDKRLLVKGDNEFVTVNLDHRNYQDKSRLTWSNDIAGDANFRKLGTGTLYFTGRNSYLGKTLVEEGTLSLSNALTHSDVMIEKNGTLHTENSEQAVEIGQSVTNNGSLDVYGKGLSIGGNYTADKDARTVIDIHTALLEIKGTADMQNSRILADVEKINDVPTQSESLRTILKAGNLVNYNNFYTVSDHIAPYILVSKIEKQGNEIQATYKRNQTCKCIAKCWNCFS